MDLHLKDKVVVVTGGSSGIGEATAKAFLEEGAKVAICARNEAKLQKAKDNFKALGYDVFTKSVNVRSKDSIQEFADDVVKEYGSIDVWINNVAKIEDVSIMEYTPEAWNEVMESNINSTLYGTQAAAGYMKENGGGTIVNTSSVASLIPSIYKSSYGTTKHAVNYFTQISAGELAPFGIRVNAVAPGSTNTPLARSVGRDYSELCKSYAIQRLAEPEEIANAFLFLASDVSSYITGVVLPVVGGKFLLQDCNRAYEERR